MTVKLKIIEFRGDANPILHVLMRNEGISPLQPGSLKYMRTMRNGAVEEGRVNIDNLEPGQSSELRIDAGAQCKSIRFTQYASRSFKNSLPANGYLEMGFFGWKIVEPVILS
ncbi:hypothetical protein PQR66_11505 [Paraburkholderia agricolaris]|uniref:Uncharacterized protein n=1 Tax=Paraburkholderia agricolaris TaxID=2152888 RepID=A0ABW8ZMB7_9BURK